MSRDTLAPTIVCEADLEQTKARALDAIEREAARGVHFTRVRTFKRGDKTAIEIKWRQE
jgi:hypothetical protein